MTNKELQQKLAQFPDDVNVFTAKDEEGNGFNEPWAIQLESVIETDDYDVLNIIADEDLPDYEDDATKAVVIW